MNSKKSFNWKVCIIQMKQNRMIKHINVWKATDIFFILYRHFFAHNGGLNLAKSFS